MVVVVDGGDRMMTRMVLPHIDGCGARVMIVMSTIERW